MLNKIKNMIMKKEEKSKLEDQSALNLQEQSDQVTDIENVELENELDVLDSDVDEMNDSFDEEYLEYSAEAVGYENREQQWDTYRVISNYIEEGDSVLDFGCARGDFEKFYEQEYQSDIDYIGVDMNQQLIEAGRKVYNEEVELICSDWFSIDDDVEQDWCINIGSSNLRYDGDTVRNDMIYLQDTIKAMVKHSKKGSILLLASDTGIDDGLINWNAGDVLNWAQQEFGNVAIDHTFSKDLFTVIIYKN